MAAYVTGDPAALTTTWAAAATGAGATDAFDFFATCDVAYCYATTTPAGTVVGGVIRANTPTRITLAASKILYVKKAGTIDGTYSVTAFQ